MVNLVDNESNGVGFLGQTVAFAPRMVAIELLHGTDCVAISADPVEC
jgi:hypothetical protein